MNKRHVGTFYENIAKEYLLSIGYEIICMNYRCRLGEIDIICRDGETVVFVEVKYRKNNSIQNPLEAVDIRKQIKIRKVSSVYVLEQKLYDVSLRYDVIGILGDEITHIEDAF